MWIDAAVAWMVTYWLHSTLLIALAALATGALQRRGLAAREAIWRTALVGALLTATVQVASGWRPVLGSLELGRVSSPAAAFSASEVRRPQSTPRADLTGGGLESSSAAGPVVMRVRSTNPSLAASATDLLRERWRSGLVGLWILGALALAFRTTVSYLRLGRTLRDRIHIESGPLGRLFRRLLLETRGGRNSRLASSSRLPIPIAYGVLKPEVCIPERVARDLEEEQQETLLAHELAHLDRRDPAWLFVYRAMEGLFFFQPLNFLVVRRLQLLAEYQCDDWAVARTGRPLGLAKCLTRVAGWRLDTYAPIAALGMATRTSGLGRRVRRLLDRAYPLPQEKVPRWLAAALVAALVVLALSAPGVRWSGVAQASEPSVEAPPPPQPAPVPEADESPEPVAAPEPAPAAPSEGPRVAPTPAPVVAPTPSPAPRAAPRVRPMLVPVVAPRVTPSAIAATVVVTVPRPPLEVRPALVSVPRVAVERLRIEPRPALAPAASLAIEPVRLAAVAPMAPMAPMVVAVAPVLAGCGDCQDECQSDCEEECEAEGGEECSACERACVAGCEREQVEDQIEDELEEVLDALEDEIDEELDGIEDLFDEVEDQIEDAVEGAMEVELEALEDQIEAEMEEYEDEMDSFSDRVEDRLEATGREREGEVFEREMERLEEALEAVEDGFDDRFERIEERAEEQLERVLELRLSGELEERLAVLESRREARVEGLERAIERVMERAERMSEEGALDREARARLREEARELARQARPSREEIEALRQEARRLAEQARPSAAELETIRAEARRAATELREEILARLAEQRQELQATRKRYE